MAVGEHHDRAPGCHPLDLGDERVAARCDLVGALAARTAVAEEVPFRVEGEDLARREALVAAVVELDQSVGDRRLVPGETEEAVIAEFEAWLADFEHESGGMTARIVALAPSTGGPSETAAEYPFVRACQAGLAQAGLSPELSGLIVNCDMTHFRSAGIPAVVCGPGSPDAMHVRDEHLAVESLERAVTAYASMARHWLGGAG